MTDTLRWGKDLHLLSNLDSATDRDSGNDLGIHLRPQSGQWDLDTHEELDNLKQALLLHLLTRQGELSPLGHPEYGSRLSELIGENNTAATRHRAKLFVLLALKGEARIAKIVELQVLSSPGSRHQININLSLQPKFSDDVLNLVFPFFLEGGPA